MCVPGEIVRRGEEVKGKGEEVVEGVNGRDGEGGDEVVEGRGGEEVKGGVLKMEGEGRWGMGVGVWGCGEE